MLFSAFTGTIKNIKYASNITIIPPSIDGLLLPHLDLRLSVNAPSGISITPSIILAIVTKILHTTITINVLFKYVQCSMFSPKPSVIKASHKYAPTIRFNIFGPRPAIPYQVSCFLVNFFIFPPNYKLYLLMKSSIALS